MKKILLIVLILLNAAYALATDYTVKTAGGDYSNVITCMNAISPGDRCVVYTGSFAGGTITNSGTDLNNFITLVEADGESATITSGFDFGTQDYIRIGEGLTINSGSFTCSNGGSFIQIIGNDFVANGQIGQGMHCHDVLFSDNTLDVGSARDYQDAHRLEDDYLITDGVYNIVSRNNAYGNWASGSGASQHVDFFQHWCYHSGNYGNTLTEGNTFYDITGTDQHLWLAHCNGSADASYHIIRYNKIIDVASTLLDTNEDDTSTHSNIVVYNNTSFQGTANSAYFWTYSGNVTGTAAAPNNLFYNALAQTNQRGMLKTGARVCPNNLSYDPDGTITLTTGCLNTSDDVIINQDPDFTDANPSTSHDLSISSTSPARDAGTYLTLAAGAGSNSTALTVDDPIMFQDGWAGIDPDCIAIGTVSNTACIVRGSMGYPTPTGNITLDTALTWSDNAPIWLYKKSDGAVVLVGSAPDIGAEEYTAGDTTAPACVISTSDPQAVSSDLVTIQGTCTDAVGVTAIKARLSSAPDASNGTSCTCDDGTCDGTSEAFTCSFSGLSQGANTVYVGGGDAAANWSTGGSADSITVNYTIAAASITVGSGTINTAGAGTVNVSSP